MAGLTSIRIPREAIPVLGRVLDLDESHLDALVEALSSGEVRELSTLKAAVKRAVGDVWPEQDDTDSFVGNLMSMLALGGTHNMDAAELADLITRRALPSLKRDGAEESLPGRLARLLTAQDLVAFGKAVDIITEHDRLLHLSRIITDIRPVFGSKPSEDPMGAVIVHTLRIDYFEGGRINSVSFAMDGQDLANLKEIIERAEEKQNTLSRTLQRADLPEFNVTSDDDE